MADLPHFSAVIFDLDGLVLDTKAPILPLGNWHWRGWAMRVMLGVGNPCRAYKPMQLQQLQVKFGVDFNVQCFAALSAEYWREHVGRYGIAVKTGFNELLAVLKANKYAMCWPPIAPWRMRVNV